MSNWQDWLNENYKILSKWSRKWHPTEWRDLLSTMALYLEKNWAKFSQIPDGEERIKFMQTWMKNNTRWKNSDFNKGIAVNNLEEEWSIPEQIEDQHLEIMAEDMPLDLKQFVIDISKRFEESDVKRIILVRKIYLTLQPHERVLYDLYITQMLSIRGVASKLNIPPSAVHRMIIELKEKINKLC